MTRPVRKAAEWMETTDDRILETLTNESWSTPHFLSIDVDGVDESNLRDRCEILRAA